MSYEDSWGNILGRDIAVSCRFCLDGIGELADVSCGDAWYLTAGKKPDFSEHDGRNIVFARTPAGASLIKDAAAAGRLTVEEADVSLLSYSQTYQETRRMTMYAKVLALKIFRHPFPKYPWKVVKRLARKASFLSQTRIFMGTVKRILNRKI